MISKDLNVDGSPLTPEVKDEIQKVLERRDVDLAHQIAFMENGLSLYTSEDALCQQYEISRDFLNECKVRLRNEIESFKEKHRYAKYRVVQETAGRLDLYQALREAALKSDAAKVEIISKAIAILDKSAPIGKLDQLNKILQDVGGPEASMEAISKSQTIIFNQNITKADEILAKKRKTIDVEQK